MTGVRSENVASMRLTAGNYIDAFALLDSTKVLRAGGFVTDQRLYGYEDWEIMLHLIAEEGGRVRSRRHGLLSSDSSGSMYAETAEDKGPRPHALLRPRWLPCCSVCSPRPARESGMPSSRTHLPPCGRLH